MIIIPGIELSTDTYYLNKKTKIHLLGYGYDYEHPNLNKMIDDKYLLRKEDKIHERNFYMLFLVFYFILSM